MDHTEKEKKKSPARNIIGRVLLILQLAAAAILIGFLLKAGILPLRYIIIALAVLALLLIIVFLMERSKKGVVRAIGGILSLFMIGMSVFGTTYVHRLDATLSGISSTQDQQVESMIVIVCSDDAADTLSDMAGYTFATAGTVEEQADTSSSVNQKYLREMVSDVQSKVESAEIKQYESPVEACRALTDQKVDAVICSSVYPSLMDDIDSGYSSKVKTVYTKNFVTETENTSEESTEADASGEKDVTKDAFNVYISGIDVSGPISTVSRSDVNIIMTVNPTTHKILLTTTPRDYYVYIPGISGDSRDKLTHSGIYGIDASMATLENLYGIQLDYYVRINFDSLVNIVDALGGIDVNSEYEFDSDTAKYHFNKGTNHLNGKQALAFSRERHAFQSGDNQRGKNQEAVLTAIIAKMQTSAVLTNAGEVMSVIEQSTQTDISRNTMNQFIRYQISVMPDWDVQSQAATGTGDMQATYSMGSTKLYVMWPDEDVVKTLAQSIKAVEDGK